MVDTLHSTLVGSDLHVPKAHHATHEPGGSDALAEDAAAATPSLRSLGTLAVQAAAGNHGHLAAAISDFAESVDDRVAALLLAGAGITLTYDDAANTLTVAVGNPSLSRGSAALVGDVAVPNTSVYTDGPGVGLAAGTWLVSGRLTLTNSTGAAIDVFVRLYEKNGPVIAATAKLTVPANGSVLVALAEVITLGGALSAFVQVKSATTGVSMIAVPDGVSDACAVTGVRIA